MIVGTSSVDEQELSRHVDTITEFYAYCDSLVPREFRHNKKIRDNQRYVCALMIRKNNEIKWDRKKYLINQVMRESKVTGYTDTLHDVEEIFEFASKKLMDKYNGRGL